MNQTRSKFAGIFLIAAGSLASTAYAQQENRTSVPPPVDAAKRPVEQPQVGTITFPSNDFGLKAGDIVVEIDGQAVSQIEGMSRLYSDKGKIKEITVQRDGKPLKLKNKASK